MRAIGRKEKGTYQEAHKIKLFKEDIDRNETGNRRSPQCGEKHIV